MDRREFLKTSGVAAAGAASVGGVTTGIAGAATAASHPGVTPEMPSGAQSFVLAVPQSLAHIEVMTAAHRMAARLQTLFDGRRHVTVETTVEGGHEAVTTARADAYLGLESQHAGLHPAFALLSSLPIGTHLDAMMHQAWLSQGEGRDMWQALAADHGVVAFAAFHTGPSAGLYAEKLFSETADLKGARIATRGLAGDALKLLGAEVVTLGDGDLKGAISAARLDGAEPLMAPTAAVAHWSFGPGVTPAGHILSLGLRESTWARLSPSERMGIEGIAAETAMHSAGAAQMLQATAARLDAWRRWPVHTAFSPALARDLAEAGRAAVDAVGGHDVTARRLVESLERMRSGLGGENWSPAAVMV